MKQEKRTNVKSITVNKTKVSLKAKKTFQIKATAKTENAKKKGSYSIFVIANNGVSKEIKVTVK
ncbi:MAG: hypothetical protein NC307_01210 [Roseburia sp.]|nr:hypothetical protein [Roseburia sp.]